MLSTLMKVQEAHAGIAFFTIGLRYDALPHAMSPHTVGRPEAFRSGLTPPLGDILELCARVRETLQDAHVEHACIVVSPDVV